jgi:hypothetical protein
MSSLVDAADFLGNIQSGGGSPRSSGTRSGADQRFFW